ncbi:MAG: TetR/AcrR family transcriptional regulator [Actinomycetota bacterium]
MSTAEVSTRRRGRPRATDSAETRRTILDVARRLFAERGYGGVTNKDLAAEAGLTSGALYHYVESKLDLYCAVYEDMQEKIYERFQKAEASEQTFIGKLEAVLEEAHDLNHEDPSLARFVGIVRSDARRHPDVRKRLGPSNSVGDRFFLNMVECGIRTGEIAVEDQDLVREFVMLILVGLTEGVSEDPPRHRRAVDSIIAVLHNRLVRPLPPDPSTRRL